MSDMEPMHELLDGMVKSLGVQNADLHAENTRLRAELAAAQERAERLRAALEQAARRFMFLRAGGVGLTNGIDPFVGMQEARAALTADQPAQEPPGAVK